MGAIAGLFAMSARLGLALAVLATLTPGTAAARPACDRALVLVVDASFSIDAEEWAMQRDGTAAALRAPAFLTAIGDGGIGRVAMTLVAFAERAATLVPWRIVETAGDARAFADAVAATARPELGVVTLISEGLREAADRLDDPPCAPDRPVVDVSADGPDASFDVETGADGLRAPLARLAAAGATVNALAIDLAEPAVRPASAGPAPGGTDALARHFRRDLVAGTGGFVVVVRSAGEYGAVLLAKILRELS